MSAIIDSIIARNAGKASHQHERNNCGPTTGHHETAGGLRGHSIDQSIYPWRVVGHPGGAWSVVGADNVVRGHISFSIPGWELSDLDDLACDEAHDLARHLKAHHPSGRI